jgi:hypothetical protein
VSDSDTCFKARQGSSKRTRGVALYDEEVSRTAQPTLQRSGHGCDVEMRVFLTRAAEIQAWKMAQAVVAETKSWVLSGADQCRRQSERCQGAGNWFQLDGFGPGANDQINTGGTQPSPLLGGGTVPPLWTYLNGNCRRRPGA